MKSWALAHKVVEATDLLATRAVVAGVWLLVLPLWVLGALGVIAWEWLWQVEQRKWRPIVSKPAVPAPRVGVKPQADGILVYVMDSLFLRQCLRDLTPTGDEELMIVSGVRLGNVRVPFLRYLPEYAHASVGGVAAKPISSHERFRMLREHGHSVLAMFHSHPGSGPGSVSESGTDVAAQERFERAGYQVITGIFSRDGYVRFFANTLKFRVRVHGSGVTEVKDGLFKIETAEQAVSLPHDPAEGVRHQEGLGHAGEGPAVGPGRDEPGTRTSDRGRWDREPARLLPGQDRDRPAGRHGS